MLRNEASHFINNTWATKAYFHIIAVELSKKKKSSMSECLNSFLQENLDFHFLVVIKLQCEFMTCIKRGKNGKMTTILVLIFHVFGILAMT